MKPVGLIFVFALLVLGLLATLAACQRALMYFPHREEIAPDIPGVSAVRIATEDGETLVAWWSPPPPGGPTFLFFDGNAGRPDIQDGRWERIIAGGAGFLAVYYRGYSGSTGRPTEAGLHADARAGYVWLIAHGVAPRDMIIHGFSLGSGVAAKLASERPARALILEAPFTAAVDVASEAYPLLPARSIMRDQFRSRDWIGEVRYPVFIAHGDADSVIPYEQGERLFALANEPKTFLRMPGSDHATLVRDGLYDYIWAFLAAHPAE
jgi:uncharacterized protein